MPFKRCTRCGKDFLAKDDKQELCNPACPGAVVEAFDARPTEGRWFVFPLFFLCCCIVVFVGYENAYDVELFLVRNVQFMRESMASKLTAGCPDSLDQVIEAVADPDIEVAKTVLLALAESGRQLPDEHPLVAELIAQLKQIYDSPDEDLDLKRAAVAAMGTIRDPDIESLLYRALRDVHMARGAVLAMKIVGTERAIEPLIDIVKDEMQQYGMGDTRYQAVIAIGRIHDKNAAALPVLIEVFRDPSGPLRDEALTAMELIVKRWKDLSLNGQDHAREALKAIKQFGKSDRLYVVRERSKAVAAELERVMH